MVQKVNIFVFVDLDIFFLLNHTITAVQQIRLYFGSISKKQYICSLNIVSLHLF